ncbi:MAG TPA: ABC transporter permease [Actinomycetota bacterium]|nr:ABC transporter permease [Actinomycetota bacterium]
MTESERTALAPVRLPERSIAHDLRAVKVVWHRELIRFVQDRGRLITGLLQPVLYLFVLGTGLSTVAGGATNGVNFRTFIFPGVLALATMFTAIFAAGSIVWDREFGFLREMLVAPVSRSAIVIGKCLGGATVATIQGGVMLVFAGAVGIPYSPVLLFSLVLMLLVLSFTLTALGVVIAARMKNIQTFFAMTQIFLLPMFFLSGALYPLNGLPGWLHFLTRIDPMTYAVDPMRKVVFSHLNPPIPVPGVTWGSWHVPIPLELGIVLAMGFVMMMIGIAQFRRTE